MTSANAYIGHLAQSLSSGGSETTFYLDKITTLTGETLTTADFSIFGKGTITIDPLSTVNIEFASFTAVDGTNIAFTGGVRGLSAFDYTASTSRAQYHPVGTTVIIAFGVHNLLDLVNYVAGQVTGTIGTATNLVTGSTKLSVAAASPTIPIAVGDNDPRVPTQGENDALVGTSGTPSSSNKFVTNADTSGSGAVARTSLIPSLTNYFSLVTSGQASQTLATQAANFTIAHGLGVAPRKVRIFAVGPNASGANFFDLVWTAAAGFKCIGLISGSQSTGGYLYNNGGVYWETYSISVDATNITVGFANSSGGSAPPGAGYFNWEAMA